MKSRRPDRYTPPEARDQRRRRDDREMREAVLIPVVCATCDIDVGEARVGEEVCCGQCGSWVRAGIANLGMVA